MRDLAICPAKRMGPSTLAARLGLCHAVVTLALMTAAVPVAQAANGDEARPGQGSGWSVSFGQGYTHQFNANIGNGNGGFSVDRFGVEGGIGYAFGRRRSVAVSLGYGFDRYRFSGGGLGGLHPWDHINTFRLSVPVRWGLDDAWTMMVIPTLRYSAGSGTSLGNAGTGGAVVGLSYRCGDRLSIGPGFGVMTRLEDHARVFPMLMVDWKLTDDLRLQAGRGALAALGPGINLNWTPSEQWTFAVGGHVRALRFRLDEDGIAPNGVGDDRSFPVYCAVTYNIDRRSRVSLLGGVALGGELRLLDHKGHRIIKEDCDATGFVGFSVHLRF